MTLDGPSYVTLTEVYKCTFLGDRVGGLGSRQNVYSRRSEHFDPNTSWFSARDIHVASAWNQK